MVMLDTTFLIDVQQRRPEAVARLEVMRMSEGRVATSAVCAAEVLGGAFAKGDRQVAAAHRLLRSMQVLDFDARSAGHAGELLAHLEASGEPLGFADTLIAGATLRHRERLVTRDTDFDRIPRLRVERY